MSSSKNTNSLRSVGRNKVEGDVMVRGVKLTTPKEKARRISERVVHTLTVNRLGGTLAQQREALIQIIAAEVEREID